MKNSSLFLIELEISANSPPLEVMEEVFSNAKCHDLK